MKTCTRNLSIQPFLFQVAEAISEEDFQKALAKIEGIHPRVVKWRFRSCPSKALSIIVFPEQRYNLLI